MQDKNLKNACSLMKNTMDATSPALTLIMDMFVDIL